MEYNVEFLNDKGQKLYGIMHAPAEKNLSNVGAILFNFGIDDRVGPHRLNLKIARALADKGHYVLRFDTQGIGFSEGKLESGSEFDNFIKIQNGIFLDDALASINFLSKEIQADRIVLIGLCGGAITALAAAARDKRIETVILIDVPVYLDEKVRGIKKSYSLSTWKEVFMGQLDIVKILQLKLIYIKDNLRKIIQGQSGDNKTNPMVHQTISRPMNKKFVQDFLSFILSKKRIFFIMSESSLAGYEFNYKFKREYLLKVPEYLYKIIYVSQANHHFHSLFAQTALLNEISNWITESHGSEGSS
jgi:pimeloyl-ACP methyl ester carboxylesterase